MAIIEGGVAAYNYKSDGSLERIRSNEVADPDDIMREDVDGNFYCKACGQLIDCMWAIPHHAFCSVNNQITHSRLPSPHLPLVELTYFLTGAVN